ncbi:MAG: class II fumarate hydratase [Planctomycetia bacterium]|nr:class II fumarate hydratase [Planctomycetia bacterium]
MSEKRVEHDALGTVELPREVYYGAQTQRAVDNFPISGSRIRPELIHALGLIKWAAAKANSELGLFSRGFAALNEKEIEALIEAARQVANGDFDQEFPIDVFQTGSGTSSNMNTNEVISNRACELAGYDRFSPEKKIHPNDHVNKGQSTNDMFPTAIHTAAAIQIQNRLIPALKSCRDALLEKSEAWSEILKTGRTHLADATPISLGQEMSGFARQFELSIVRAEEARDHVLELPAGGTAVGTGINTHPEFGERVSSILSKETGIAFRPAANHFEANAQRDGLVACHSLLKTIAVSAYGVGNNIRWLSSGPRCGYYEIKLQDLQPGSSIMPGKINPVLCESLMQAAARVIGNDSTIAFSGASGGQFQLNIMMPIMGDTVLESIRILSGALILFSEKCLKTMIANEDQCKSTIEKSLSMVTGLNTIIGYEKAAQLAKEAFRTNKTIRQLCEEQKILPPDELDKALDPWKMTRPLGN